MGKNNLAGTPASIILSEMAFSIWSQFRQPSQGKFSKSSSGNSGVCIEIHSL
ncbi:MAG: hypothetical protein FWE67_08780 [Planctomycetaceae bacterium]|nr:hypothetical protein [Planctomycetaceae bacterium]